MGTKLTVMVRCSSLPPFKRFLLADSPCHRASPLSWVGLQHTSQSVTGDGLAAHILIATLFNHLREHAEIHF